MLSLSSSLSFSVSWFSSFLLSLSGHQLGEGKRLEQEQEKESEKKRGKKRQKTRGFRLDLFGLPSGNEKNEKEEKTSDLFLFFAASLKTPASRFQSFSFFFLWQTVFD